MCNRKETKDREGIKCAQRQSRCTKRERESRWEIRGGRRIQRQIFIRGHRCRVERTEDTWKHTLQSVTEQMCKHKTQMQNDTAAVKHKQDRSIERYYMSSRDKNACTNRQSVNTRRKTWSAGIADVRRDEEREPTNYRRSTFKCEMTLQTAAHRIKEKCVVEEFLS